MYVLYSEQSKQYTFYFYSAHKNLTQNKFGLNMAFLECFIKFFYIILGQSYFFCMVNKTLNACFVLLYNCPILLFWAD